MTTATIGRTCGEACWEARQEACRRIREGHTARSLQQSIGMSCG